MTARPDWLAPGRVHARGAVLDPYRDLRVREATARDLAALTEIGVELDRLAGQRGWR